MSGDERGDYSVLQKIQVACRTCGASDSFYSNLSVEQFKSRHRGHDVTVRGEKSAPPASYAPKPAPVEEKPAAVDAVYAVKPPPKEEEPLIGEAMTRISKVRVDLVVFPVLPEPVFRVRGFKDDGEEAFITTVRSEHAVKVREIIAGGEYVDHDLSGVRYSWEPEVVEYGPDARERLGLPAPSASVAKASRPRPEPRQPVQDVDASTVAMTNELLFGESKKADAGPAVAAAAPPAPRARLEARPPPSHAQPREEEAPGRDAEVKLSGPKQAVKSGGKKAAKAASQPGPAKATEETEAGYLLVSKSWYIQGGKANREEALRISQVLKEFRWKVEPVYTIGVILDDMLSIEANRNEISRDLITRVEGAGYRLTAVTTEQGKPVAWFKRSVPETASDQKEAKGGARGSREAGPLEGSDAEASAGSDPGPASDATG